jgi:hypothetical protein
VYDSSTYQTFPAFRAKVVGNLNGFPALGTKTTRFFLAVATPRRDFGFQFIIRGWLGWLWSRAGDLNY